MPRLEETVQHYGRLGVLSEMEWKRCLGDSGELLFKRQNGTSAIIGPTLDDSGKVIGDAFAVETMHFMDIAQPEQRDFYLELLEVNQTAAKEYLLTVSGTFERWRKDVMWLNVALKYLREEGQFLRQEQQFIQQENGYGSKTFPDALKRHFPQLFYDIDFTGLSLDGALQRVKTLLEEQVLPEERYLDNYLSRMEREMPFLFGNGHGV
ncbi:hypothetical protein HYU22_05470 [Candidatus Woesearchaeota archaeon]|nr:hypothetical protein [Candidatus Woesearchaeota archaeon]